MSERNVPLENLEIWHRAAAENRALRLLQITELAGSADRGEEEAGFLPPPLPEVDAGLSAGGVYGTALRLDEQMAFCRARLPKEAKMPTVGELSPPPATPRVARLSGGVFDAALKRFLPLLGNVRQVYLASLGELMEEVAAGSADFAILPVEDGAGTRLLRFFEDFDRLELHVSHVCAVRAEEEAPPVRFALLSRLYTPVRVIKGEQLLEYRLSGQDPCALTRLLMAAEDAALRLCRVDALPDPLFEEGYTYHVILAADDAASAALLHAYLEAALPRAELVGTYIDLKEGT